MKENTVLKDVDQWIREKVDQNNLKVELGKKRLRLLGKEQYRFVMKGLVILQAVIAVAAITGLAVTMGIAIAENQSELPNPNVSIHMDYEVIRDDGVVVIHYSDGSKLFKASMDDGISTHSGEPSKKIETNLEDKVTVVEKIN